VTVRQSFSFGDIAQIKGGKRVPKGYKFEEHQTPYPYVSVSDFTEDGTVDLSKLKYVNEDVHDQISRYTISSTEMYLSIAGTIGKTGFVPEIIDGAHLTENACKLIFKNGIDPRFIYYFTKSNDFEEQARSGTRVSAQPKLALERLKKISLNVPPLPEQRRIVAVLDEAFEGLAIATADTEKNLKNAREVFESYLNSLFGERGEGWEERRFGEICENLDSQRVPITKSVRSSGDIPYYGASGIVDYVSEHIFDEDLLLVSEDGANLLARTYPIAFSVSGKCWVNNHAHVVRFSNSTTQRFVELFLNSITLEPYVSGMAQPKLNQKSLNSIAVPLPRLGAQEAIVSKVDELETGIERLEVIFRQKLAAIAELKQSLLQKAFAGELTKDFRPEEVLS
jgi:type I restriction enzyme, S subunit